MALLWLHTPKQRYRPVAELLQERWQDQQRQGLQRRLQQLLGSNVRVSVREQQKPSGHALLLLSSATDEATVLAAVRKHRSHCDNGASSTSEERYTILSQAAFLYATAPSAAGLHSALATLEQLVGHGRLQQLPALFIADAPAYRWRGFHLDVARHFFTVATLERLIPRLGRRKLNVLHLHLTDDQGWRLHVPSLPKLSSIGGYRRRAGGSDGERGRRRRYGGFYGSDDVARLVVACATYGIEIVPEIDVPGHMGALLAAYPEHGCSRQHGAPAATPTAWGVLPYSLCLATTADVERSAKTIEAILAEVVERFPASRHIHLGGDEVPAEAPEAHVVALFEQLLGWLERRGRVGVVWDEALSAFTRQRKRLPANAIVHAWQGAHAVAAAVRAGVPTIASPQEATYLNKAATSLAQCYHFAPMPCAMDDGGEGGGGDGGEGYGVVASTAASMLLGGSACLWSEYVPNERSLRRHAFPRLTALADALWVGTRKRATFADFRRVALRAEEAEEEAEQEAKAAEQEAKAAEAAAVARADGTGRREQAEEEGARQWGMGRQDDDGGEPTHLAEGSCVSASLRSYLDGPEGAHHPDKAIDGDASTFWWSEGAPQPGDTLSVRYARPREACGVRALTGSADGRDRCRGCRVRVCVVETVDDAAAAAAAAGDGACLPRDVGRIGADGSLSTRLEPRVRVRQVEVLCEEAQHEWLIVRELGVEPCGEAADEGSAMHDEL